MWRFVLTLALLLVASNAFGLGYTGIRDRTLRRLQDDKEWAGLTQETLDVLLDRAANELDLAGATDDADFIRNSWPHMRHLLDGHDIGPLDVGDHSPLSIYLALIYIKLTTVFSDSFLEFTHLKDIWILNFTLPVVFKPHVSERWCLETDQTEGCEHEWILHWTGSKWHMPDPYAHDEYDHYGFAPVVVRWIVFGVCEAATWGTDATLLCSPISDVIEIGSAKWLTTPMGEKIFERLNQG